VSDRGASVIGRTVSHYRILEKLGQRILAQAKAKHEAFKRSFFPSGAQPNIGQVAAQAGPP
jgi:hypothetical protein